MLSKTFAVAFLVTFVIGSNGAQACSCASASMRHRNVGCKGEFMAIVNITAEQMDSMRKFYSFKLLDDYTTFLVDQQSIAQFDQITTGIYEAVCGVTLQVGTTYLLKGQLYNEPHIGLCGSYIKALPQVPTAGEAKALLADAYKREC